MADEKSWDEMTDDEIIAVYEKYRVQWDFQGFTDVCVQSTWMTPAEWVEAGWGDQSQARWQRIHARIIARHGKYEGD